MPRRKPSTVREGRRRRSGGGGPSVRHLERDTAAVARRRAVCAAKDHYETEAEARAFAIMHQPGPGPRLAAYRCEECGGWHHTKGRSAS